MKHPKVNVRIPSGAATFYVLGSVVIMPWTFYLAQTLPAHQIVRHWDLTWVGLDIGLVVSLLITGILASIKSLWVSIPATMTGSFLLVDAWFDIVSARPGGQMHEAVLMALCLEIPLAFISYLLAYRVLKKAYYR